MGGPDASDVAGGIAVTSIVGSVIECRGRGHLRKADVEAAQCEIERLAATAAGPLDALFDGSLIDTFEPGLPMVWVQWLRRSSSVGRIALVGRPGPMLSVARTFLVLLPTRRIGAFASRGEALSFLVGKDAERLVRR
jgi:hypothetical protein